MFRLLLAALLLLLLQQFVESNSLFGIKRGAKLFYGLLQFLTDFWLNRLHQFLRTFLGGAEYFVDLLLLVGA